MKAKETAKSILEAKRAFFIVPILAMIISALVSMYVVQPVYRASTTLMVFKQPEYAIPYEVRMSTIALNQRLAKTYQELAQSRLIFEEVIKQNNLKISVDDLRNSIKVETLGDTEFLRINVENANPSLAAMLANETARILMEKIAEIMVLDNIQVIDTAAPPQKPVWPNHLINIVMAGVIGILLVVGVVIFRASTRTGAEEAFNEADASLQRDSGTRDIVS